MGIAKLSLAPSAILPHLNAYSFVDKSQHDNIDDSAQAHSHRHKHSENGQEHEHRHDHSKIAQHEIKTLNRIEYLKLNVYEVESTHGFLEKYLISNPHFLKFFRPPIA